MVPQTTSSEMGVHHAPPRPAYEGTANCCRLCRMEASAHDHTNHEVTSPQTNHGTHGDHDTPPGEPGENGHEAHQTHTDHTGHEIMFRRRFWVSLVLSIPVIVFSEFIQGVVGYTAPVFPGSTLITPVLAVVVFAYGGVPFLRMARTEVQNREPGMMLLISLAITVAVNARRLRGVELTP